MLLVLVTGYWWGGRGRQSGDDSVSGGVEMIVGAVGLLG